MEYTLQFNRMVQMYEESCNNNIIRHFFAQLSNLRPLYMYALSNAIDSDEQLVKDVILHSVTYETWMQDITLIDIRNHIVFLIWKEFKTVIATEPYHLGRFVEFDRVSTITPTQTKELGILIETIYYIHHVHAVRTQSVTGKEHSFHEFIYTKPLAESVEYVFNIMMSVIRPS